MTHTRKTFLAVGIALATCATAWAEPPAKQASEPRSKKVRQVGTAIGPRAVAQEPSAAGTKHKGASRAHEASAPEPTQDQLRAARAKRVVAFRAMQPRVTRPEEIPKAVRDEMLLHATRMARLSRIEVLAKAGEDQSALKRTLDLLARERARHQQVMARLWPPTPSAAPTSPGEEEPEEEAEPIDPDVQDEDEQEGAQP